MKYFTALALLGLITVQETQAIRFASTNLQRDEDGSFAAVGEEISDDENMYGGSTKEMVQIHSHIRSHNHIHHKQRRFEEKLPDFHGYTPEYSGFEGNNHNDGEWRDAYKRELPAFVTGDEADSFTKKIIKDFAVEGQDKVSGKPNGLFYVSKDACKKATYEVLSTHLGLKGAEAQAYNKKYFDDVWDHMDVNQEGHLMANEINKFMRSLAKPVKEHIDLM